VVIRKVTHPDYSHVEETTVKKDILSVTREKQARLLQYIDEYADLLSRHYEDHESDLIKVCRTHVVDREKKVRQELELFYQKVTNIEAFESEIRSYSLYFRDKFLQSRNCNYKNRSRKII
jgi:hypothetical protein